MIFLRVVLVVCAIVAASASASMAQVADVEPHVIMKNLDDAWREERINGVNKAITKMDIDKRKELVAVVTWAQQRYALIQSRDARVGLLLADMLSDVVRGFSSAERKVDNGRTMSSGAQAFISSQLIAFEDIARCADKTAGETHAGIWLQNRSRGAYQKYIAEQTVEARSAIWEHAKRIADERDVSRIDKRICATGAEAITKMKTDAKCKKSGGCDPAEFVEMVDDNAWKTRRAQVQAMVEKRVKEGKL